MSSQYQKYFIKTKTNSDCCLAIRFTKCEESRKDDCLHYLASDSCIKSLANCPFRIIQNPLCFCKDIRNCSNSLYEIRKYNKEHYIFYYCKGSCKFFIKKGYEKILNGLHLEHIYYDDALKTLVKKVFKNKDKKPSKVEDEILEYFEGIMVSITSE